MSGNLFKHVRGREMSGNLFKHVGKCRDVCHCLSAQKPDMCLAGSQDICLVESQDMCRVHEILDWICTEISLRQLCTDFSILNFGLDPMEPLPDTKTRTKTQKICIENVGPGSRGSKMDPKCPKTRLKNPKIAKIRENLKI